MSLADIWNWLIHANLWIGAGVIVLIIVAFALLAQYVEWFNARESR